MMKAVVYKGGEHLGDVDIHLQNHQRLELKDKKLRITHFSHPSDRCSPLSVLHTISSSGILFKIDALQQHSQESPLLSLYSSCLDENKTAVVPLGQEELHLVAMPSKKAECKFPYFWGYSLPPGLYSCCLAMLNLRCLGIVFDLDETLIVANTMRSFEDKIDALQKKVKNEPDPHRASSMLAEITRYQDDKNLLKQYAESDQIVENGNVVKIQTEVVPVLSGNHPSTVRPLIRLPEKNIILTRINPLIRDTSVLVRLRPAWEDLRSYLTARGRKRFEVYVCTMAERDYALEMWRLLDPEFNLINSKELLNRIVCVKSGLKKSLFNVFQDGICHPKMALVIDDRLKVWDEKDQSRVHVVPAFAPYYAPQAEANNTVPVLCVARNVACNVRGGFFKEFDDGILQWISKVSYEDDVRVIPSPDVSNYLLSDVPFDDGSTSNGNMEPPGFSGLADPEVERKLKDANSASLSVASTSANMDSKIGPPHKSEIDTSSLSLPVSIRVSNLPISKELPPPPPLVKPLSNSTLPDSNLSDSPAREEGEVPEYELDPDTRRRLLILQHGQDSRDHTSNETPFPTESTPSTSLPAIHHSTTWLSVEDERNKRQRNQVVPKEFPLDSEFLMADKHRLSPPPFFPRPECSLQADRVIYNNHRSPFEVYNGDDMIRSKHTFRSFCGEEAVSSRPSSGSGSFYPKYGRVGNFAGTPAGVLQGIAINCGTTVEFRTSLVDTTELMFSIEVWFDGEKIGNGVGRTRKEAQHYAAESSLKTMAYKNQSYFGDESGSQHKNIRGGLFCERRDPSFEDMNHSGNSSFSLEESKLSPSEYTHPFWFSDSNPTLSNNPMPSSITALKDLCMMEGLDLVFQPQLSTHINSFPKGQIHAQVEVDGQIIGKGTASTWDEAKLEASQKALSNLKTMLGQFSEKPPRSQFSGMLNKRLKKDNSGGFRRTHSTRYTYHHVP